MRHIHRFAFACLLIAGASAFTRAQTAPEQIVADPHRSPEWALVASHLPDPVTATPERLEITGDVLRARRFPADAMTYYKAAAINGGNVSRLLKKEGVVHLEMQHGLLARLSFEQAIHLNKKDAEAWNNLGASDFMLGNTHSAVGDYKHALKLNRNSAIYHSNLALAYFEGHNSKGARQELARALALDPEILHHSGVGGYNLQILGSSHYAEICFEMARASASQGDTEATINWLTKASERGFDVRGAMKEDPLLQSYLQDDRVKTVLANVDLLHSKDPARKVTPPSLSAADPR